MCNAFTDLMADSPEVEELKEEIERLEKERDWWKAELRKEIEGSFYGVKAPDEIMKQYEKRMKKMWEKEKEIRSCDNKGASTD